MKTFVPIVLTVLAFGVGTLQAAEPLPPRKPLLAADCIKTDQINDWHIVDARTAIVRTGPKHYLVTLQNDCPQLNHPPGLMFRSSPGGTSEGRICGSIGETVRSGHQAACAIESVKLIDKTRFEKLTEDAKHYKDGTAPAH
jgi:hypothetical protein